MSFLYTIEVPGASFRCHAPAMSGHVAALLSVPVITALSLVPAQAAGGLPAPPDTTIQTGDGIDLEARTASGSAGEQTEPIGRVVAAHDLVVTLEAGLPVGTDR